MRVRPSSWQPVTVAWPGIRLIFAAVVIFGFDTKLMLNRPVAARHFRAARRVGLVLEKFEIFHSEPLNPPVEIFNSQSGPRKFTKPFQLLPSGWNITQVASFRKNGPRRARFRGILRHRASHALLRNLANAREFSSPPRAESMF